MACACSREQDSSEPKKQTKTAEHRQDAGAQPLLPELLYLPDGGDAVQNTGERLLPGGPWQTPYQPLPTGRCPPEMVDIAGRFCIDRYEATLVDAKRRRQLSPFYHPTRTQTRASYNEFRNSPSRRGISVPEPPSFQLEEEFEPLAESRAHVLPSGYLSGVVAARACALAGKRLCAPAEWVLACRGERNRQFPYGDQYVPGQCNVFREGHAAVILHGDASRFHLDPRLNLVEAENGPLLRKTGETPTCRSEWGSDAVFDMVGNVDEWIDEPSGAFAGGFFSRATRDGCSSKISSHPPEYFDYSLGVRCCR